MTLYDELVARGLIAQVTDEEEIKDLINNGKATFYIGFDPTADSLHVGHFMALCLMKRLQMAGNKPIALIGGGTAMIGDPSGRTDMRQMMTPETIQHNCDCFKKQMSRFIDFSEGKALMVNNADWLMDLNYIDVLREVGAHFSVNRMLTAECYKQRMEKGLSFLEFNYMIMQSYDFYTLYQKYGCNMEFGGDDQWSNMLGGTELIRRKLGKDAYAMTINLLLNSEGKKMGKIFYILGKSSSGKDTIFQQIKNNRQLNLKTVVGYTTRPMRVGEKNGVEYYFVSPQKLEEMKDKGKIIECRGYNTVHGLWNYFTADDGQIDLDSDNNYLYIGTLEAYKGMRKYYGEENVIPFYIYVEPGERLSRAVERERRQENPKYTELCRRFIADEEDFSREKILEVGIDKIYENDKLFECVNNIENDIKKYL